MVWPIVVGAVAVVIVIVAGVFVFDSSDEGDVYDDGMCTVSLQTQDSKEEIVTDIGMTISEPNAPEIDGMRFEGWYLDSEYTEPFDFSKPLMDDVTLYPKYVQVIEKETCIVSLDAGEGTVDRMFITVYVGETMDEPANPIRNGFEFGGWYIDRELTVPWDFDEDVVAGNMTLYARWTNSGLQYNPSFTADREYVGTVHDGGTTYTFVYLGTASDVILAELSSVVEVTSNKDVLQITNRVETEQTITDSVATTVGTEAWIQGNIEVNFVDLFKFSLELGISLSEDVTHTTSEAFRKAQAAEYGHEVLLEFAEINDYVVYGTVGDLDVYQVYVVDGNGDPSTYLTYNTRDSYNRLLSADEVSEFTQVFDYPIEANLMDSGSGTADDPFVIATVGQFTTIGMVPDASYSLEADLDLSELGGWSPIGVFSGELFGNGHVVRGMDISIPSDADLTSDSHLYGLFGSMDGRIENMSISDSTISFAKGLDRSGWVYAGLLAATGSGSVSSVSVIGSSVTVHLDRSSAGCIAGSFSGSVEYCVVRECTMFTNGDAGGIVGNLNGGIVSGCTVIGEGDSESPDIVLYGTNNNRSVGGVAGYVNNMGQVRNCVSQNIAFEFRGEKTINPAMGYVVGSLNDGLARSISEMGCSNKTEVTLSYGGSIFGIGSYNYSKDYFAESSGKVGNVSENSSVS